MLAEVSGTLADTGKGRLLPGVVPGASPPKPAPSRRTATAPLSVGTLLHLVSIGLVATATIAGFFGIGFFLLVQAMEEMIGGSGTPDRVMEVKSMLSGAFPHLYSDALTVLKPTELSRSAAAAPIILAALAKGSAAHDPLPPQTSQTKQGSAQVSPDGEGSASAPAGALSSGKEPGLKSTARMAALTPPIQTVPATSSRTSGATLIPPAQTASAPELIPNYPASPAPAPPPASRRHSAAKIAKRLAPPAPQIRHAMREKVNTGLVGIVSGGMDATGLGEATDLAVSLDGIRDHLRILPVVGKGAFQNVTDIVFARGIDVGIIQSDVLATLKRDPPFPGIENFLQYITKLYDEEVHILAGKDVVSIEDLASKKVNFGMPDSGTYITAEVIFRMLGITVEATSFPQPVALDKLRRGEITALVFVVAKPARLFQDIRPDETLHFLSIATTNDLRESYTPASLRSEDYPDLIDADKSISTVAVGSVLAVYNWPAGTERHRKVTRFVRAFFDRLHELQAPPYHPKWREIDVAASVPGWTRFPAAEQWIKKAGLAIDNLPRNARLHELTTQDETAMLSARERDAIFTEFIEHRNMAGIR
jgi:TRAP-type uncharacterized transport system substrate-binding protein